MRWILALVALLAILAAGRYVIQSRASRQSAAAPWTPVTEQTLAHGRFEKLSVYIPHAPPKGVVLLLSGGEGWGAAMADAARRIAGRGALVVGIDTPKFNAALEADGGQCVYPDGDLENLSHFMQAYFHLSTYLTPILAGYSTGATLAYATLVQAPPATFAGAVSVGFCPAYPLKKPLCAGSGIAFAPAADGNGVKFLPATLPSDSWTVIQPSPPPPPTQSPAPPAPPGTAGPQACDGAAVRQFVAQVAGATLVVDATPAADAAAGVPAAGVPAAVERLMDAHPGATATLPSSLGDLPLVTLAAQPGTTPTDTFAIILSGDGGWAGLDKEVAAALVERGIPVVGLDSLRYFWSARTPAGLATDLDRITRYYLAQLGKRRVLLIGYSQGADVLPFAVNRLSAETRSHVALAAIIGMSEHALFEFHVTSWVSDDDSGPATLPEVERIQGLPVLCIYGEGETDTLCPKLDPHKVTIVKLKGGHHFDGDYAGLAKAILASVPR